MNRIKLFGAALGLLLSVAAWAGPVEQDVAQLQQAWDVIKYRKPAAEQEKLYEQLAQKAAAVVAANPNRAEPLIWQGIIVSSLAGARGGVGALGLVKQARAQYEEALKIAPDALNGSAYNSLGVLYYKVPGWPLGFGDKAKAKDLLQKALAVNPDGIDANFFFAEYLVETGHAADAVPYLEKAIAAPPRPGREIADAGRRDEALQLLARARKS
ncbi:MAG: hypothetical protein ING59_08950 [Burkholderiales bacterium]|jgi:tetratricopeptide (TPR) repeat protein|nr:hypothetical protein [Burkholderiales bacterium]